jgi:hypothetical protein
LDPGPLQNILIVPDPHLHTIQPKFPSYFNAMIMLLGPFTKDRLWPSSLVVSPQKRATVTKKQQKQQTSTPGGTNKPTVLFLEEIEAAKMWSTSRRGISTAKPAVLSLALS